MTATLLRIASRLRGLALVSVVLGPGLTAGDLRLIDAVKAGDREAVHALLAQHVAVNASGPDGATAIEWASYRDDLDTANLLIHAGAERQCRQ